MYSTTSRLFAFVFLATTLLVALPACDRSSSDSSNSTSTSKQAASSESTDENPPTSESDDREQSASEPSPDDETTEEETGSLGSQYELGGRVLVVLSGANSIELQNGEAVETGFFMNELAIPGEALTRAGLELVYATPGGATPHMDPSSDDVSFFESKEAYERYRAFLEDEGLLDGTAEIERLKGVIDEGLDNYVGLFVPGGLAPTVDLATNGTLGGMLERFHEEHTPTAMLCHGPAALLSVLPEAGSFIERAHESEEVEPPSNWPYADYKLTVISQKEDEQTEETLGGDLPFYPERVLRETGAEVEVRERQEGFVTRHEELITGQNPMADREFTRVFLEAIAEWQSAPPGQ